MSAASLADPATHPFVPFELNRAATYRVRDLQLNRGDVKMYFSEGVISFLMPVQGQVVGAVFSTAEADAGDAEVIAMPAVRSERVSLASFIGSPNLDEHLRGAVLFFSDGTGEELKRQIESGSVREAPELTEKLTEKFRGVLNEITPSVEFRLTQSLLDHHPRAQGFFYAAFFPRVLPPFSLVYEPDAFEPVTLGRGVTGPDGAAGFEIWAAFQPRSDAARPPPENPFSRYRIDVTIAPDLALTAKAAFDYRSSPQDGRVLRFDLSEHLRVESASVDGSTAEVVQRQTLLNDDARAGGSFLVITPATLAPGIHHVTVEYAGSVIRQTAAGTYFVDDRTDWFPQTASLLSTFDLTFHCPASLQLVATGEPLLDEVKDGVRTVHRVAAVPRPFAGFNLGRYRTAVHTAADYRIEIYTDATLANPREDLARETERVLEFYTRLWQVQPLHTLAISPITGYFGQGFPGLVYLSAAAFIRPEDRSVALQTKRVSTFLSQLLLPHEIAHQWWGNLMYSSNYRSGWLIEALASYSALQYIERQSGPAEADRILGQYRTDLLQRGADGTAMEAAGSLDWGTRLLSSRHPEAWQPVVYGKGTWILHMLRQRLGDERFLELEKLLLQRFSEKTVSNEDLRELAAGLLPHTTGIGARDPDLRQFFDSWVYATGIPKLGLKHQDGEWLLAISNVTEDYTVDVPLICKGRDQPPVSVLVRAGLGENPLPSTAKKFANCSLPLNSTFLSIN